MDCWKIIRIFHGIISIFHVCEDLSEGRCLESRGFAEWGIRKFCWVMPNSDPEGRIFLSAPNNHDRFFFLHILWPPAFYFNVGVCINESHSYSLSSAILEDDFNSQRHNASYMTSSYMTNQCIDMYCYSIFICPTGWIRVCQIRFVSTGENCGNPCLVCKKRRWQARILLLCCPSPQLDQNLFVCLYFHLSVSLSFLSNYLYPSIWFRSTCIWFIVVHCGYLLES